MERVFSPSHSVARTFVTIPGHTITNVAGSSYGSGRSETPFTMLKIAVLAPIPSARVRIATAAKARLR
jgi:hypothetical protein